MMDERFYILTVRELSDELSADERQELNSLLKNHALQKEHEELTKRWSTAENDELQSAQGQTAAWEKVRAKIGLDKELDDSTFKGKLIVFTASWAWLRWAASVLLVGLVGWLMYQSINDSASQPSAYSVAETAPGERLTLVLYDGSRVVLNGGSRLEYSKEKNPEESQQRVKLVGEAYFEVQPMADRLFVVETKHLRTEVLGTGFNVHSYEEDSMSRVSLVHGRVQVIVQESATSVLLEPNEQVEYLAQKGVLERTTFKKEEVSGWKDGKLVYVNAPLRVVLLDIERYYGVRMKVDASIIDDCSIRANFNNDPIEVVLEVLGYATGLQFKFMPAEQVIQITGKPCQQE